MRTESDATRALRRAAVQASKAPSVRNTEPWRLVLTADSMEIHADQYRQLRALDPRGRQLIVSCGCALLNARASLAFSGYSGHVSRFPDADRPNLVARIHVVAGSDVDSSLAQLNPSADPQSRVVEGRPASHDVPAELVDALLVAGAAEGAHVLRIAGAHDLAAVTRINTLASDAGRADPARRAELHAWTTGENDTARGPGNDIIGSDWLPTTRGADLRRCLFAIGTDTDDQQGWLQAGEALERMLLEVARAGYSASPMTQVLQPGASHVSLRDELDLAMYPHALLSVGRGPIRHAPRRRRLVDVLTEVT